MTRPYFVNTICVVITYDETKREVNLAKHGLDLADAALVYDSPDKVTLQSPRGGEDRLMDVALVEVMGVVSVLVFIERGAEVQPRHGAAEPSVAGVAASHLLPQSAGYASNVSEVRAISLRRASKTERRLYENAK